MASAQDLPDPSWYLDTGASNHVTSDLSSLTLHSPYRGPSKVSVGNGQTLDIQNIGSSILPTPYHTFCLKNMLDLPSLSVNNLSVQHFAADNICRLIFYDKNFAIQEKETNHLVFRGFNKNGLYPIPKSCANKISSIPSVAFSASTVDSPVWHNRLGHPGAQVLQKIFHSCIPKVSFSSMN